MLIFNNDDLAIGAVMLDEVRLTRDALDRLGKSDTKPDIGCEHGEQNERLGQDRHRPIGRMGSRGWVLGQ